jgi:hypothetical protein
MKTKKYKKKYNTLGIVPKSNGKSNGKLLSSLGKGTSINGGGVIFFYVFFINSVCIELHL